MIVVSQMVAILSAELVKGRREKPLATGPTCSMVTLVK
jgi:hypothetical protein